MKARRKIKIKMRKVKASQIKDKIKELFLKADVINYSKKLADSYYKKAQIALDKLKLVIHKSELEFYENLLNFVVERKF